MEPLGATLVVERKKAQGLEKEEPKWNGRSQ